MTRDDSRDYEAILWSGIQADTVRITFEKLTCREWRLLEERNVVCMTCGRASPLSRRKSFKELAIMFEGSSTGGAERACRKAVEKLTVLLVEAGVLRAVRLKRKSVKPVDFTEFSKLESYSPAWGLHLALKGYTLSM